MSILEGMTAPAWSALVSSIALIVTITVQILEWRRTRFSRALDLIASMETRFESREFREQRRTAAYYLMGKTENILEGREALEGVLSFFETLGFLYSKKAVDAQMVWHFFGSWLLPYYSVSKHIIDEWRAKDPGLYCELQVVYQAIRDVECQVHPSRDTIHMLSRASLDDFLISESLLSLVPRPSATPAQSA